MSSRKQLISLAPRKLKSTPKPMPSLREFWEELQRAQGGSTAPSASARGGSGYVVSSGRPYGSGQLHGSGSGSGSGSGCGGYGIDLIAPACEFSRERILAIMRDLCARDGAPQT